MMAQQMETKKGYSARELAVLSLCRLEREGKFGSLEADSAIKKFRLEGAERALYTKLFYGVTERRLTLDHVIAVYSDKKPEELSLEMKNILRVSVYQILYLDRVPDYSAVNEGAELAKKYVRKSAASFVNAVLRRVCRDGMPEIRDDGDAAAYCSVKYSVSPDICRAFIAEFGKEETEKLLSALFRPQYITLRVNTLRCGREELISLLADNGITAVPTEKSPFGVRLCEHVDTTTLLGIVNGLAYIEDEASQIAVASLAPRPGEIVADVCAAPGGKTVSAAIMMENKGVIYASDIHENKLKLIEKTARLCGTDIIRVSCRDGRETDPALINKCDRVLCDVPCSGLGVLAKKPDMRYKEYGDDERLIATQRAILRASARYVKAGGTLVYSTCTVVSRENGENVSDFLAQNGDFTLVGSTTLLPHRDGTDGFYVAVMKKDSQIEGNE